MCPRIEQWHRTGGVGRGGGPPPRSCIAFTQRYVYAGNNPILFTDPSGLRVFGAPCPLDLVVDPVREVAEAFAAAIERLQGARLCGTISNI